MMYKRKEIKIVRWITRLITLAMCLSIPVPALAVGNGSSYTPATGVSVVLEFVDDEGKYTGESKLLVQNDKVESLQEGMSYDPTTSTLTLENFNNSNAKLSLHGWEINENSALTINLKGHNRLFGLSFRPSGWGCLKGDGELNITSMFAPKKFVMESGTLNIFTEGKYYGATYAFDNAHYQDELMDKDDLACYRFLGGKVNIDYSSMPDVYYYDYEGEHHSIDITDEFVGMDVQCGDVEIRNADVKINLGHHGYIGLGVGYTGREDGVYYVYGGKLTMENGSLEIRGEDLPIYFYDFSNEGNPLYFNIGKGSSEKAVSFEDAFSLIRPGMDVDLYDVSTGEIVTGRYELDEDYSYLLITTEKSIQSSDWAKEEIQKAYDYDLVPEVLKDQDLTQRISRAEFAAVSVKTFENLSPTPAIPAVTNPFTDTKDLDVLKAYNLGIVNGYGGGLFGPNDNLNREQCATMLTRAFKKVTMPGWSLETDDQFTLNYKRPALFADDHLISSWAKDSVYFMVANNIIKGMGNNMFAPRNTTSQEEAEGYATATREQALVIAVRMVENLK